MVPTDGFEPPTVALQERRSTVKSYAGLNFTPSPLGILPLPLVTEAGGIGSGSFLYGEPDGTWTRDLRSDSAVLSPAELQVRISLGGGGSDLQLASTSL